MISAGSAWQSDVCPFLDMLDDTRVRCDPLPLKKTVAIGCDAQLLTDDVVTKGFEKSSQAQCLDGRMKTDDAARDAHVAV